MEADSAAIAAALTPIVVDEINNAFESHVGSPEGTYQCTSRPTHALMSVLQGGKRKR